MHSTRLFAVMLAVAALLAACSTPEPTPEPILVFQGRGISQTEDFELTDGTWKAEIDFKQSGLLDVVIYGRNGGYKWLVPPKLVDKIRPQGITTTIFTVGSASTYLSAGPQLIHGFSSGDWEVRIEAVEQNPLPTLPPGTRQYANGWWVTPTPDVLFSVPPTPTPTPYPTATPTSTPTPFPPTPIPEVANVAAVATCSAGSPPGPTAVPPTLTPTPDAGGGLPSVRFTSASQLSVGVNPSSGKATASIEERIYAADVIVRVSRVPEGAGLCFRAVEYLKGAGASAFRVWEYPQGGTAEWMADNAVLFLIKHEGVFVFADTTGGTYGYHGDLKRGYTADRRNPVWLPILGDRVVIDHKDPLGRALPSVSLADLRTQIAWVGGGEGIEGYDACIRRSLDDIRRARDLKRTTERPGLRPYAMRRSHLGKPPWCTNMTFRATGRHGSTGTVG